MMQIAPFFKPLSLYECPLSQDFVESPSPSFLVSMPHGIFKQKKTNLIKCRHSSSKEAELQEYRAHTRLVPVGTVNAVGAVDTVGLGLRDSLLEGL